MTILTKILPAIILLFYPVALLHAQENFRPVSPMPEGALDTGTTDSYLAGLFTIFLVVAVVLAVIRLMICGIQYITSESVSSKGAAKTCIQYVIGGLLLLLISWITLNTVSSSLTSSSFSAISNTIQENIGDVEGQGNLGLDGSAPRSSEAFDDTYQYRVRDTLSNAIITITTRDRSSCYQERRDELNLPRWTSSQTCFFDTEDGNYQFILEGLYGWDGQVFVSEVFEPLDCGITGWFCANNACVEAYETKLKEPAYVAEGNCEEIQR